ncbi:MAG TPA: hypothetical protein VJR03_01015 [Nitrospira sp.]|nr:hypothetical protein [Nitrospira sp.]
MRHHVGRQLPALSPIRFRRIQVFPECGVETAVPFVASAHGHVPHPEAGTPLWLVGS